MIGSKKNLVGSSEDRRQLIDPGHPEISIARQCELVGLPRSSWYYRPCGESPENLELMARIDEQYTTTPFYGSRRMTAWLRSKGFVVNRKRVGRLMRRMDIEAIYPKPRLTVPDTSHRVFPYLLRGVRVVRPCQVWSSDITYVRLRQGFLYLVAIIDWYSRYVLSWELSNSLEADFCVAALERALRLGQPEIFNTDQGCQFTSEAFTSRLSSRGVAISMDGRGRALDNVFVERLWRSVKYEEVYPKNYQSVAAAMEGLGAYFPFYNTERPHQALGYRTPLQVFVSN